MNSARPWSYLVLSNVLRSRQWYNIGLSFHSLSLCRRNIHVKTHGCTGALNVFLSSCCIWGSRNVSCPTGDSWTLKAWLSLLYASVTPVLINVLKLLVFYLFQPSLKLDLKAAGKLSATSQYTCPLHRFRRSTPQKAYADSFPIFAA